MAIAWADDISFHAPSYALALLSCVLHTGYLVLLALPSAMAATESSPLAALYFNAVAAAAPVTLCALVFVDWETQWTVVTEGSWFFAVSCTHERGADCMQFAVVGSILQGALLTWAQMACTIYNSPFATTIVGQVAAGGAGHMKLTLGRR